MGKKLLFFDIDATLVDEKTHRVPKSAIEGLKQAKQNEHLIFINTGRCKSFIQECLKELPIDGYVYACGSHIEYQGKILFEKFVAGEDIKQIRDAMTETGLQGIFQGPQYCYFGAEKNLYKNFQRFLEKTYKDDYKEEKKSYFDKNIKVNKLVTFRDESCDYARFVEMVGDKYQLIDNGGGFTEILPLPYTKATGMDFLMDYFHIKEEDCYVFGDSPNDLPMMLHIKNSIAMGNSYDSIKEIAGYVTTDIDKDGVYHALKHFKII